MPRISKAADAVECDASLAGDGLGGASACLADCGDDELMLLARSGQRGAFDVLVRRYRAQVVRTATRRLHQRELAEDVAQQTFIKVFRMLQRYEPRGAFSGYLVCVLFHECAMVLRSARAERRTMESLRRESSIDGGAAFQPEVPMAEELLSIREDQRALRHAIQRLSPKLRAAVELVCLAELGYREAAEVLRIPSGTVKRRVFDALTALRSATQFSARALLGPRGSSTRTVSAFGGGSSQAATRERSALVRNVGTRRQTNATFTGRRRRAESTHPDGLVSLVSFD